MQTTMYEAMSITTNTSSKTESLEEFREGKIKQNERSFIILLNILF